MVADDVDELVELTSDQLSARLIFERGEMASLTTLYEVEVVATADSHPASQSLV